MLHDLAQTWPRPGPTKTRSGPDMVYYIWPMWARPGPHPARTLGCLALIWPKYGPDLAQTILPDQAQVWPGSGLLHLAHVGQTWATSGPDLGLSGPDLAQVWP